MSERTMIDNVRKQYAGVANPGLQPGLGKRRAVGPKTTMQQQLTNHQRIVQQIIQQISQRINLTTNLRTYELTN